VIAELKHLKRLRQQLAAEITDLKAPDTGSTWQMDTDGKHPEDGVHFFIQAEQKWVNFLREHLWIHQCVSIPSTPRKPHDECHTAFR
jgi:NADPH-dependent ferric siderophore reductase